MFRRRRPGLKPISACLLCLAGILLNIPAARADIGATLAALADTPFEPVGRSNDPPVTIIARVFAEDGAGFLWAGGQSGLLRWNGYTIRTFGSGRGGPDGLTDHDVRCLYRDSEGTLWVGTGLGGIAFYDPMQERFVPMALPARQINAVTGDGAGGLWIATEKALFHTPFASHPSGHWPVTPIRVPGLQAAEIATVLQGRDGTLWIGGDFGLARSTGSFSHGFTQVALPSGGAQPRVSRLLEDEHGHLWIGTHDGAYRLTAGGTPERIAIPGSDASAHEIMAMAEIVPGEIWLGLYGQGIVAVRAADGRIRRITHDSTVSRGLDSNVVFGLYRDQSGLGWVATPLGLSHVATGSGLHTLFGHVNARSGLAVDEATALLVRHDGSLWVGSESNGLEMIAPDGSEIGALPIQPVVALAEAPDGRVFAGGRGGLYAIDAQGRHFIRFAIPGRNPTATVWCLLMQGDALWIGGDDGLWVVQASTGTVLRHEMPPRLPHPTVMALSPAGAGKIAVGTGNGLVLFDETGPGIDNFGGVRHDGTTATGSVASLATDDQGRLWIGGSDDGIMVVTGRETDGRPRIHRIQVQDGLPNGDINKMLPDRNGRMWVSTDNGLATVDMHSFAVRAFGRADGVGLIGFWNNSGTATPGGDLLFGGEGGIALVEPDQMSSWRYVPPIAITNVSVDGKPVTGWARGELTLPPGARSLSVEFAALDFSAPSENRYRYRLDGFDTDWTDTDSNHRLAVYTNLSPRKYVLRLAGTNRSGQWTQAETHLLVNVRPAWFQSNWFLFGQLATAVGLFFALIQARTAFLRARQHELERQVQQRTAELHASQEQLQHFAYFDSLTALPNRRAFNDELRAACHGSPRPQDFALAIVDLDGFKTVNDTIGHDAGDALLALAASRIRSCVRETDFVARLGGDEFAIILRGATDLAEAEQACGRIVTDMAAAMTVNNHPVQIGASVGVALFKGAGDTPDDLYKRADMALYDAKRGGRGMWRWYSDRAMHKG